MNPQQLARFEPKVDKDGPLPDYAPHLGPCWLWTAATNYGYGVIGLGRRQDGIALAHRLLYEHMVGPIPEGLCLDHLCRVRACVNPAHMEVVTLAENKRRGESGPAQNARKTHCPQGHPYDEANTYRYNGWRQCRTCCLDRRREATRRRRQEAS